MLIGGGRQAYLSCGTITPTGLGNESEQKLSGVTLQNSVAQDYLQKSSLSLLDI